MTSTEKAKTVMSDLVRMFSTNTFPEKVAKAYITAPGKPSSKWSWNNRILMILSGTEDARGYKQWAEVGRHPKKGSHAIYILAPRMVKKNPNDAKDEKRVLIGFRVVPVFRYEDTEGEQLPQYAPRTMPPLLNLAKLNGLKVAYDNSRNGEFGSINLQNKTITLSTESPDTFLHELVHWYDLRNRDDAKSGQDKTQEIVAQFGSCVLSKLYGYDATEYTWNYISSYSESEDPEKIGKECVNILNRVGKVIDEILADAEKIKAEIPELIPVSHG